MKLKLNDKVLLLGKDGSHLVVVAKQKFNTKNGELDISKIVGKSYGTKIRTHLGKEFYIVRPSLLDLFGKFTRTAQIILPKDIGLILAYTGISPNSLVVDAGTGTGYLSVFLASYLTEGKVVTYEKDMRFIKIAKENIKLSGLHQA